MNDTAGLPYEILLVEDSEADVFLLQEAFESQAPRARIRVASDGVEAMFMLREDDPVLPDLILLDLNLPRKSGLDVLEELRAAPELSIIPVMVLSTSAAAGDVQRAYELGANAFMPKARDLGGFLEQVRLIDRFWFSGVRLPHRKGGPRHS